MKSHTLGKVLGEQWKIEECIGAGGMGEVYRARDLKHLRAVAVKVLEHNDHSTDEIFDRFNVAILGAKNKTF